MTLARLAASGDGFKMHFTGGYARPVVDFHEVGCPPYAVVAVDLDGNTDAFMQRLCSQHYAFVYGDVQSELKELCRLMDITVV